MLLSLLLLLSKMAYTLWATRCLSISRSCSLETRIATVTFEKADLLEFHRDNCMYEWTSAIPTAIGFPDGQS